MPSVAKAVSLVIFQVKAANLDLSGVCSQTRKCHKDEGECNYCAEFKDLVGSCFQNPTDSWCSGTGIETSLTRSFNLSATGDCNYECHTTREYCEDCIPFQGEHCHLETNLWCEPHQGVELESIVVDNGLVSEVVHDHLESDFSLSEAVVDSVDGADCNSYCHYTMDNCNHCRKQHGASSCAQWNELWCQVTASSLSASSLSAANLSAGYDCRYQCHASQNACEDCISVDPQHCVMWTHMYCEDLPGAATLGSVGDPNILV